MDIDWMPTPKPLLRKELPSIFSTRSFPYPLPKNYLCCKILKQNKKQSYWWFKATNSRIVVYVLFCCYKKMNIWKSGLIALDFTSFSVLICFNYMTWQIIKCKQVHHSNTSFIQYFKKIQFTVTIVLLLSYKWKLFGTHLEG